ncbi:hypothetical protein TNCV_3266151 [Trichonephila clavipes]|nr:hypothetical protein TNCV_3266151 [Trichonephila clavipes]
MPCFSLHKSPYNVQRLGKRERYLNFKVSGDVFLGFLSGIGRCKSGISSILSQNERGLRMLNSDRLRRVFVLFQNYGENELRRSVTCMVPKAKDNGRRHLALTMMNFVGLDLTFADQLALATTTTTTVLRHLE